MSKKTHIFHGILHRKAPLADEGLTFVDKVLGNVDGKGESGEGKKGSQVGGVEARQDGDEDPPGCESHANRVSTG